VIAITGTALSASLPRSRLLQRILWTSYWGRVNA
jgi:hypothetical protein